MKHCPHCNAKLGRTGAMVVQMERGSLDRTTIHVAFANCPRCGGVLEDYDAATGL